MAEKQIRRAISLNRAVYETIKRAAKQRGKSIAHFVEDALRAAGVELPATTHVQIADVQRAVKNRPRPPKKQPQKQRKGAIRRAQVPVRPFPRTKCQ